MTLHAIERNPELSILIVAAISGILFVLITALQRAVHRTHGASALLSESR